MNMMDFISLGSRLGMGRTMSVLPVCLHVVDRNSFNFTFLAYCQM